MNEQQLFKAVFDDGPIGMAIIGSDLVIRKANKQYLEIVGRKSGEVVGKKILDLANPDDRIESIRRWKALMQGETTQINTERGYKRPDGKEVWTEVVVSVLRDERGNTDCILAMVKDVTPRKEVEAKLKEANERMTKMMERLLQDNTPRRSKETFNEFI